VRNNFGRGSTNPVPEPTTFMLAALAAIGAVPLYRARRKQP
jgi:hypothetical protein